ncbi:MAG TPA: hypothetical protein VF715_00425 [Thermoleophilaceae bacterium]|jgi:hypothetical protein
MQTRQNRTSFRRPRKAVVIGRWADDTALLRTSDGTTLEAPVPEPLRQGFDVGAEARLDDDSGRIVGWTPADAG